MCEPSIRELGTLVKWPLTNFRKAIVTLNKHFDSKSRKSHIAAVERAMAFCSVMEKRRLLIDQQLMSERAKTAAENRLKMRSIAATVMLCGRRGILRGHRDDRPAIMEEPLANHGNFHALLDFRVDAGDKVLQEHLQTASRNAIYTSKDIQNELIIICGIVLFWFYYN